MRDFKGNELNIGDKVLTISSSGHRTLKEGIVVRMTAIKAEIGFTLYDYKNNPFLTKRLKESYQLFKLA